MVGSRADQLQVTIGVRDRWVIVEITGELDLNTAPLVDEHLGEAIALYTPPQVALNLAGLRFCDSSGLNAFIRAWLQVEAAGGRLVFLNLTPRLVTIVRTAGLHRWLTISDDLPDS